MKIDALYIRFFRSYNFDYLRKSREGSDAKPDPWDSLGGDELFFPFVRIPIEPDVTTVVGANEAGKSQLLSAIEALLTGKGFVKRDFCRYSTEFAEASGPGVPEFGGRFSGLTEEEHAAVARLSDWSKEFDQFHLFRFHDRVTVYVGDEEIDLDDVPSSLVLPKSFRIDAGVPLPDSVEIAYLAGDSTRTERTRLSWLSRMRFVREYPEALDSPANGETRPVYSGDDDSPNDKLVRQWELARRLLVEVAEITQEEFHELKEAVHGAEGYAEALVTKMNRKLSDSLNFRRWWSQDSDFALKLRLRDFDLVFTIQDRTGSDYTFQERSQGLKYFLSYFVQYLSHSRDRGELLLMDEPDAFLSNSGQQDLLRIFEAFAYPVDESDPVQVVYVTHSPFLINKNHAERIRVLEKGDGEEGTRVVNNAGRNHYEPLRSSLGGFVAETTFISSCNLMVEGQADPILLAGASAISRRLSPEANALDLNSLTLVPCGGAGNVSYMVHLARGRDEDKPAVLVMVDNDQDGLGAIDDIRAMKGLLPESLMFTVAATLEGGDRANITELEDLIPVPLANEAVKKLANTIFQTEQASSFAASWVDVKPKRGEKLFKALTAGAKTASESVGLERVLTIEKVAFARSVVDLVLDPSTAFELREEFNKNFQPLLAFIESKQREAMREHANAKISTILKRLRKNFVADHRTGMRKTDVTSFLENVQVQMPRDAVESDTVFDAIRAIQRDFKLADDPRSMVDDPEELRARLYALSYGVTNAMQE